MRPVERGPWPVDEEGNKKNLDRYPKAKADLLDRLGHYCSYCECRAYPLHVEHVVPLFHRPDLRGDWGNFLLGCTNCNSTKGTKNDSRQVTCGRTGTTREQPSSTFLMEGSGFARAFRTKSSRRPGT